MSDSTYTYCPICAAHLVEKCIVTTLRPTCPACGFILFLAPMLVAVVVVRHKGKFLLGRRTIDPGKGMWSFFGGYVDRGEKVEDAALREVKEETNLDVQLEGLIGIYSGQGELHVLIVYQASVIESETNSLMAQPEEVGELAYFTWEELPEFAFPIDRHILNDWRRASLSQQGTLP